MKKILFVVALFSLLVPLQAQLFKLELMPQIGFTNGSTVLNSDLFSISMDSGVNYGIRTDLTFAFVGVQLYYVANSLQTKAIDKLLNLELDFSDKFVNYGIGVILQSPGILLCPFLSATYGRTKFTGQHKYAPDGKHYSLGAGIKAGLGKVGIWAEIRFLRIMDTLKDYWDFFKDNGSFSTFSASGGIIIRLQ